MAALSATSQVSSQEAYAANVLQSEADYAYTDSALQTKIERALGARSSALTQGDVNATQALTVVSGN